MGIWAFDYVSVCPIHILYAIPYACFKYTWIYLYLTNIMKIIMRNNFVIVWWSGCVFYYLLYSSKMKINSISTHTYARVFNGWFNKLQINKQLQLVLRLRITIFIIYTYAFCTSNEGVRRGGEKGKDWKLPRRYGNRK